MELQPGSVYQYEFTYAAAAHGYEYSLTDAISSTAGPKPTSMFLLGSRLIGLTGTKCLDLIFIYLSGLISVGNLRLLEHASLAE